MRKIGLTTVLILVVLILNCTTIVQTLVSGIQCILSVQVQAAEVVSPSSVKKPLEGIIGPFSGTQLSAIELKRPIMVMVENSSAARPQVGLEQASIVYEFLVEGGISRLMALYYEKFPERIGPVRSTRPYFVHTALEYNALLLHAGGSVEAYQEIAKTQLSHLDEILTQGYYWRDSARKAPHNLYTGFQRVQKMKISTINVGTPRFLFQSIVEEDSVLQKTVAKEINIRYWGGYTVRYSYDDTQQSYLRYIGQEPHVMEDGKKLYANNIFLQYVDTKVTDAEGRLSMAMYGTGKAILFKNGYALMGSWIKNSGEQTRFLQADGTEFSVNPGQTWIQVVPLSVGLEYQ